MAAQHSYLKTCPISSIYAQRFSSEAKKVGDEMRVNTFHKNTQENPSVEGLKDGGFVIAWHSYHQDGSNAGVYMKKFNDQGKEVVAEQQVNSHTAHSQMYPIIAELKDGGFVIAWHSYHQDGSNAGVHGRIFNNEGEKDGDEFQVYTYTYGDQIYPTVAGLENGRAC